MTRKDADLSHESLQLDSLRDLPVLWWLMMKHEWSRRTILGKIFYPVWLIVSISMWLMAGLFAAIAWGSKSLHEAAATERDPPSWKYKDD